MQRLRFSRCFPAFYTASRIGDRWKGLREGGRGDVHTTRYIRRIGRFHAERTHNNDRQLFIMGHDNAFDSRKSQQQSAKRLGTSLDDRDGSSLDFVARGGKGGEGGDARCVNKISMCERETTILLDGPLATSINWSATSYNVVSSSSTTWINITSTNLTFIFLINSPSAI